MVHDTTGDSLWVDYNVHKEDAIDWLEKQGKKDKLIKELSKYKVKYTQEVLSQQLENQGEQILINNDKYQTVPVKILNRLYKSEKELEQLKQCEQKETPCDKCKREQPRSCQDITALGRCAIEHEQKPAKNIVEIWKEMRFEVYQQASGDRHEPNHSDDTTKMFSLNDIDEIIEKMSEQKTSDKIKSKFKIGDWIINNDKRIAVPTQILKIEKYGYVTSSGYISFNKVKTDYHLWTIQDANDGDVLYTTCDGKNKMIFIYNGIDIDTVCCYCLYSITSIEYKMFNTVCHIKSDICPATKEQCDTLRKAIADAGYEWDFEVKELNKIEKKPACIAKYQSTDK